APLGITLDPASQMDQAQWPARKVEMAALFKTRTRDEWVAFFAGHEVCFAPVLTMSEARAHPHNVARKTFVTVDGAPQPATAPRFSRTPGDIARAPVVPGTDTDAVLAEWGIPAAEVAELRRLGAIA